MQNKTLIVVIAAPMLGVSSTAMAKGVAELERKGRKAPESRKLLKLLRDTQACWNERSKPVMTVLEGEVRETQSVNKLSKAKDD